MISCKYYTAAPFTSPTTSLASLAHTFCSPYPPPDAQFTIARVDEVEFPELADVSSHKLMKAKLPQGVSSVGLLGCVRVDFRIVLASRGALMSLERC